MVGEHGQATGRVVGFSWEASSTDTAVEETLLCAEILGLGQCATDGLICQVTEQEDSMGWYSREVHHEKGQPFNQPREIPVTTAPWVETGSNFCPLPVVSPPLSGLFTGCTRLSCT